MRTKKCKKCGRLFDVEKSEAYLCPECATLARKSSVYQVRVCIDCGATFEGYPRSKRCPGCNRAVCLARKREQNKHGSLRKLGSTDKCAACGAEYVVESGMQRYCKACAEEAVRENTRAHKRAYNAANPEILEKARAARRGGKVCVICGGIVPSGTPTVTCSPECAAENRRRKQATAEARRKVRNPE